MVSEIKPKVLIVEDEFLVAPNLKRILSDLGFETVGIAPDMQSALHYAECKPDIALVDVNLRDGETGPAIGVTLAQKYGTSVLFVTANPKRIIDTEAGPIGVLSKPVNDNEIAPVLDFLMSHRQGNTALPPRNVKVFNWSQARRAGVMQQPSKLLPVPWATIVVRYCRPIGLGY